jgi:hypothetical protein
LKRRGLVARAWPVWRRQKPMRTHRFRLSTGPLRPARCSGRNLRGRRNSRPRHVAEAHQQMVREWWAAVQQEADLAEGKVQGLLGGAGRAIRPALRFGPSTTKPPAAERHKGLASLSGPAQCEVAGQRAATGTTLRSRALFPAGPSRTQRAPFSALRSLASHEEQVRHAVPGGSVRGSPRTPGGTCASWRS